MSENPRGDRRPSRRDDDRGRRAGGSAGPRQAKRAGGPEKGKPARGGKPHPAFAPKRAAPASDDQPDTKSVRPRIVDPVIPDRITGKELPRDVLGELRTLTDENQEFVAKHLVMAAELIAEEPELAHQHALSASRKGGRIAVVRETLAITAYRTGDFALALRELRTYRRISGKDDQLPLMVDSERGLGRPERALELGRSVVRGTLPVPVQVELAIAMSGARLDLGQKAAALQELEIPQLDPDTAYSWSPGLFDAYATVLEDLGRDAEAEEWYRRSEIATAALQGDDAADGAEEDVVEILEDLEDDAADAEGAAGSGRLEREEPDGRSADGDEAAGSAEAEAEAEAEADAGADVDAERSEDPEA